MNELRDKLTKCLDPTHTELAARFGYCEEFIGVNVKENTAKIQSLKSQVIVWGEFDEEDVHITSTDTVNYGTQEFRNGKLSYACLG